MAIEPNDPFEEVMPTPAQPPVTPRPAPRPIASTPLPPAQYTPARRWQILIGAGLVLLLGAGVVAAMLLRKPAETTTNTTNTSATVQNSNAPITANSLTIPPVNAPPDKDADGLLDEEEQALGTNSGNPDTDADGLGDREEVRVYTTDPKRPDTDGDGNPDGAEVKKGYNPKGAGLLLDFEAAKKTLQ